MHVPKLVLTYLTNNNTLRANRPGRDAVRCAAAALNLKGSVHRSAHEPISGRQPASDSRNETIQTPSRPRVTAASQSPRPHSRRTSRADQRERLLLAPPHRNQAACCVCRRAAARRSTTYLARALALARPSVAFLFPYLLCMLQSTLAALSLMSSMVLSLPAKLIAIVAPPPVYAS